MACTLSVPCLFLLHFDSAYSGDRQQASLQLCDKMLPGIVKCMLCNMFSPSAKLNFDIKGGLAVTSKIFQTFLKF